MARAALHPEEAACGRTKARGVPQSLGLMPIQGSTVQRQIRTGLVADERTMNEEKKDDFRRFYRRVLGFCLIQDDGYVAELKQIKNYRDRTSALGFGNGNTMAENIAKPIGVFFDEVIGIGLEGHQRTAA